MFDSFEELRDIIIPNADIKKFNEILENNKHHYDSWQYEQLLGTILYHYVNSDNETDYLSIVSSINNAIREQKIKTTKYATLENVYAARCRADSRKDSNKYCCISYCPFDSKIQDGIYSKYSMFLSK